MATQTKLASSHYLQSDEWAGLRAANGWQVLDLTVSNGRVNAYRKSSPLGCVVYVPGYLPALSQDLSALASQLKGNITCKLEACEPANEKAQELLQQNGWKPARHVQYDYTVLLDLAQSDEDLWMSMKSRARQEINYARRDGVNIRESDYSQADYDQMHALLVDTSKRKAFGIRERQAVMNYWQAFQKAGRLKIFFAEKDGKVIAGGVFITDGKDKVWYKDAGSLPEFSKLFGPRLLLWEVALSFKKDGYKIFDLGGIPNPRSYENSALKGIFIFKTAFAREVTQMMPAYELPLNKIKHAAWSRIEPKALKLNRLASTIKGKLK
jgi:lipid II:glycine glycyltransferase (peptidoglycan interpeptide bridge formation enzyme)